MLNNLIEWIIEHGGLYALLFIVFAETGLLVGFFLPGDTLLFAAGIYVAKISQSFYNVHYSVIILLVIIASVLGNMAGYWFGSKTGHLLYHRKDTFFFKKKYLLQAHDFYEKYGKTTVFVAKFLPIFRTFAPIIAGIVKMPKSIFTFYNILGSMIWVSSMILGGHYLERWVQNRFGFSLKEHIEVIAIVIILITTLPVLFKLFFGKKKTVAPSEI
ncbi:MAG: DedA family protein [Bacteroidota bacterium]|nr:DedA family protein [Bacteroidota bacterium]